jgi:hypothetical protein
MSDQKKPTPCRCLIATPFGAKPNYGTVILVVNGEMRNCCRKCRRPLAGAEWPKKEDTSG